MLIQPNHPATGSSSRRFWEEELENCRVLLAEIDKAIAAFATSVAGAGGITEYTLDTGQDRQTVKRAELPSLYAQRTALLCQIQVLESRLQICGTRARRIVPGF